MELLKERILKEGVVIGNDVLKVGSFLNQEMDVALLREMGKEWKRLYEGETVTKILTIENSGIGIACVAAEVFGDLPVVFAKRAKTSNVSGEVYSANVRSFTHGVTSDIFVSKDYLKPEDHILIIDDFLANGEALRGLIELVHQAGATLVGAGIAIEKGFQPGGRLLRKENCRIESLAIIRSMSEKDGIQFDN